MQYSADAVIDSRIHMKSPDIEVDRLLNRVVSAVGTSYARFSVATQLSDVRTHIYDHIDNAVASPRVYRQVVGHLDSVGVNVCE